MYYRSNTNENVTVITERSTDGLADANIRIGDMNGQITDLEIKPARSRTLRSSSKQCTE